MCWLSLRSITGLQDKVSPKRCRTDNNCQAAKVPDGLKQRQANFSQLRAMNDMGGQTLTGSGT
jgi:hypothetical protein